MLRLSAIRPAAILFYFLFFFKKRVSYTIRDIFTRMASTFSFEFLSIIIATCETNKIMSLTLFYNDEKYG